MAFAAVNWVLLVQSWAGVGYVNSLEQFCAGDCNEEVAGSKNLGDIIDSISPHDLGAEGAYLALLKSQLLTKQAEYLKGQIIYNRSRGRPAEDLSPLLQQSMQACTSRGSMPMVQKSADSSFQALNALNNRNYTELSYKKHRDYDHKTQVALLEYHRLRKLRSRVESCKDLDEDDRAADRFCGVEVAGRVERGIETLKIMYPGVAIYNRLFQATKDVESAELRNILDRQLDYSDENFARSSDDIRETLAFPAVEGVAKVDLSDYPIDIFADSKKKFSKVKSPIGSYANVVSSSTRGANIGGRAKMLYRSIQDRHMRDAIKQMGEVCQMDLCQLAGTDPTLAAALIEPSFKLFPLERKQLQKRLCQCESIQRKESEGLNSVITGLGYAGLALGGATLAVFLLPAAVVTTPILVAAAALGAQGAAVGALGLGSEVIRNQLIVDENLDRAIATCSRQALMGGDSYENALSECSALNTELKEGQSSLVVDAALAVLPGGLAFRSGKDVGKPFRDIADELPALMKSVKAGKATAAELTKLRHARIKFATSALDEAGMEVAKRQDAVVVLGSMSDSALANLARGVQAKGIFMKVKSSKNEFTEAFYELDADSTEEMLSLVRDRKIKIRGYRDELGQAVVKNKSGERKIVSPEDLSKIKKDGLKSPWEEVKVAVDPKSGRYFSSDGDLALIMNEIGHDRTFSDELLGRSRLLSEVVRKDFDRTASANLKNATVDASGPSPHAQASLDPEASREKLLALFGEKGEMRAYVPPLKGSHRVPGSNLNSEPSTRIIRLGPPEDPLVHLRKFYEEMAARGYQDRIPPSWNGFR